MIYFVQAGSDGPIKIGHTETDVRRRVKSLSTASPYKLKILAVGEGDKQSESGFHKMYSHLRLNGEWFAPHPEIISAAEKIGIIQELQPVLESDGQTTNLKVPPPMRSKVERLAEKEHGRTFKGMLLVLIERGLEASK